MQNEETKMLTRQGTQGNQLSAASGINASSSDAINQALPAQNGQGDTLPLSSGILQVRASAWTDMRLHWTIALRLPRHWWSCSEAWQHDSSTSWDAARQRYHESLMLQVETDSLKLTFLLHGG